MTSDQPVVAMILEDKTPVRRHIIEAALLGTEVFYERMKDLTLKEVYAAYKMELATYQRRAIMDRLEKRAGVLAHEATVGFLQTVRHKELGKGEKKT